MNTPSPATPPISPADADALEMFYWWPFDADEWEEAVPDYGDVQ